MLNIVKNSLNTNKLKQPIIHKIFSLCYLSSNFSRMGYKNYLGVKTFSEKVKLKERIRLVDYDKMEIEKEQWGELLANSVEKENISRFYEQINYIKQKNIPLTINEINKILQIVYNKYPKAVDLLHDWIDDNNLQMDSITYHFLIMSAIKFKGYNSAFNLFFRANLFNVPQNLTVIIALCREFSLIKNSSEKSKYKNFIQIHVRQYYSVDVSKLLSTLNIEFERDEEISEEAGKFEDILKKNKKFRKNFDERKSHLERSERSNSNLSRKKTNSLKNNKENQGEKEINNKDLQESQNNLNDSNKEKKDKSNANEQIDTVINNASIIPEELENSKSDFVNPESSENKKGKKKSKDKKSRKNYDNTLDNIFGNGGIIVIAQSLQNPDDSDDSDSD